MDSIKPVSLLFSNIDLNNCLLNVMFVIFDRAVNIRTDTNNTVNVVLKYTCKTILFFICSDQDTSNNQLF